MNLKTSNLKNAVALAVTLIPLVGSALQAPVVLAEDKPVVATPAPATVKATAKINPAVEKGNTGIQFAQSYSMGLTIPDNVKAGSKINIKVENLPNLLSAGTGSDVTSVDVKVQDTVIGKLTLKKATNRRNQQIDTKTTLDQKKAEHIQPGGTSYEYELTFNDKAATFTNKELTFKAEAPGVVFAATPETATVKSRILVNDKEVASQDVQSKLKVTQDSKVKNSNVDLSVNTQLTNQADGNVKYFLGVGVRPLDQDYGVGSKITVNLPKDSMMRFEKGDVEGKELSVIPAFTKESFVNENGVYLADVNPVKVRVAELTDNKVTFEVTEGTLKRVTYYVISSENTPVSFRLTDKAAAKLSADGKKFGPETVTSSLTTPEGKVNATDINSSEIRVNGSTLTAKGVQDLINKPAPKPTEKKEYRTRYITFVDGKETLLKDDFVGDQIKDPEKFDGYNLVRTEQNGNTTTYIYEKVANKTTRWVDEADLTKDLKTPVTGQVTEEAGTIAGYDFVRTEPEKDGVTVHVFKKSETKPEVKNQYKTEWVTEVKSQKDGKEVTTEKELKTPVVGDKTFEAGKFDGYEFVKTVKDDKGNVKHYFKPATKATEKKNAVQTGASAGQFGAPLIGFGAFGLGVTGLAYLKAKRKK